ncbi:O-antigen ligase family protein [Moraxella osloensis]|uniref:O-antigen ligase-related domain-containing protein n=1 Tax=Faucicola osloensis TaxID=34062 RepID=A0A2D2LVU5_FAUOS|nr:O-antigen ligase family protein [Moraxella osloensis]ATR79090.1 hypothetical protein NP7_07420 [Moraxella osloensis]
MLKDYQFFLPVYSLVILVSMAFLGLSFSWNHAIYDYWRILEIVVMTFSFIVAYFFIKEPIVISKSKLIGFVALLTLAILSVTHAQDYLIAIIDGCQIIILICYGFILTQLKKYIDTPALENAIAIIVLIPLYVVCWVFLGYYLLWQQNIPLDWHGLFPNIRMYDDALLPCLWLLWYSPGFLKKYNKTLIIISSLYLLTLWLDAARANWLSIIIGITIIGIVYRTNYQQIFKPVISIVLSFIWYSLFLFFQTWVTNSSNINGNALSFIIANNYTVVRGDDFARWKMWVGAFYTWLENPILGIGGGNFILLDNTISLNFGHPHNLFVQLVVEWGITGIILVFMILFMFYQLTLKRHGVPILLFGGCFSLLFNALLSGAFVYPISQILTVFFFSFTFSKINTIETSIKNFSNKYTLQKNNNQKVYSVNVALIGILALCIMIFTIIYDVSMNEFTTNNGQTSTGPRFWINAYAMHWKIN